MIIAGVFQSYLMDDNPDDKDGDLPNFPLDPEIWMYVIAIGIFGTLQQFCLIGKQYHKLYLPFHRGQKGIFDSFSKMIFK